LHLCFEKLASPVGGDINLCREGRISCGIEQTSRCSWMDAFGTVTNAVETSLQKRMLHFGVQRSIVIRLVIAGLHGS
jgi:hypothetical protein